MVSHDHSYDYTQKVYVADANSRAVRLCALVSDELSCIMSENIKRGRTMVNTTSSLPSSYSFDTLREMLSLKLGLAILALLNIQDLVLPATAQTAGLVVAFYTIQRPSVTYVCPPHSSGPSALTPAKREGVCKSPTPSLECASICSAPRRLPQVATASRASCPPAEAHAPCSRTIYAFLHP